MKKFVFLFSIGFITSFSLAGCGNEAISSSSGEASDNYEVKWISPTGSPALAFFDQGDNSNWVSTSNPSQVAPFLKTDFYDAVVFDGMNGLNIIKNSKEGQSPYKLAEWITGGTFYLVSTKHKANDSFNTNRTVRSFVENGNASKAFRKLSKDVWKWNLPNENVVYEEAGVAKVRETIESNPEANDYYVISEPILTSLSASLKKRNINLNVIYDLQDEWKKAKLGESIPAGALFINTNHYSLHKEKIDSFIAKTKQAKEKVITKPEEVVEELNRYNGIDGQDNNKLKKRFGLETAEIVLSLQKDGRNGFNLIKPGNEDSSEFANNFAKALGEEEFEENLFL